MDGAVRISRLSVKGYCCSQIMVQMGLDYLHEENELLINAAAGLCKGMESGKICGVLTGAALMLSMIDKENAVMYMIPDLVEWFEEKYGEKFGGIDCETILGNRPLTRVEKCPPIMEQTFEKIKELLEGYGHEL